MFLYMAAFLYWGWVEYSPQTTMDIEKRLWKVVTMILFDFASTYSTNGRKWHKINVICFTGAVKTRLYDKKIDPEAVSV